MCGKTIFKKAKGWLTNLRTLVTSDVWEWRRYWVECTKVFKDPENVLWCNEVYFMVFINSLSKS